MSATRYRLDEFWNSFSGAEGSSAYPVSNDAVAWPRNNVVGEYGLVLGSYIVIKHGFIDGEFIFSADENIDQVNNLNDAASTGIIDTAVAEEQVFSFVENAGQEFDLAITFQQTVEFFAIEGNQINSLVMSNSLSENGDYTPDQDAADPGETSSLSLHATLEFSLLADGFLSQADIPEFGFGDGSKGATLATDGNVALTIDLDLYITMRAALNAETVEFNTGTSEGAGAGQQAALSALAAQVDATGMSDSGILSLAVAGTESSIGGLSFTLTDTGGAGAGSAALSGFQQAAALWSNFLHDSVNVRLDIGFSSLGSGILGSASSNSTPVSYSAVRSALVADQTSADDATATANLQVGSSLSFATYNQNGQFILDNNASSNNNFLDVNTANLKALGITTDANGNPVDNGVSADANITFSNNFSWDFDPSNGIGAGLIDFVGVAFHEIGHALGFTSGVDTVDYFSQNGPGSPIDLNGFSIFNTLDLFRYSTNVTSQFAGALDLGWGGSGFFSIDGANSLGAFSTGSYNGDGRQASHWKDNLGLGIMDPTSAPAGQANVVTALDIMAMDVIGWDVVGLNTPPVATIADQSLQTNQWSQVNSWVTYSDAENSAATQYEFWDSGTAADSGYFYTPGNAQHAANTSITVAASDLANVWVRGGQTGGTETMWVRAFDGSDWSAWDSFVFTTQGNTPPVATIADQSLQTNQWSQVNSWVTYSDTENSAATQYEFWDGGTASDSGYFYTPGNAQHAANTSITVAASDLDSVWVRGGQTGGSETMWVRAFDGSDWSAWDSFVFTTTDNAFMV